jgi:hypothetical protein
MWYFPSEIAIMHINARRAEEKAFEEFCATLTPEEAKALRADKKAKEEKAQEEATKERRHRELCEAIRSLSFWRF